MIDTCNNATVIIPAVSITLLASISIIVERFVEQLPFNLIKCTIMPCLMAVLALLCL